MEDRLYTYIRDKTLIDPDKLRTLRNNCERRTLKRSEVLLSEGEVCNAFYFVEKGYLRTAYNKDGQRININFTLEGAFASNLKSFKTRTPSELSIEAGENSTVLIFPRSVLKTKENPSPELLLFSRRLLMDLMLTLEEHSHLFVTHSPAERYAWIEKNNPDLLQRVPLTQLASYLGITRETLSRIRKNGGKKPPSIL